MKKNQLMLFTLLILFSIFSKAVPLKIIKEKSQCTLHAVAKKMNMENFPKNDSPEIIYSAESSLSDFQNDIERFWNMRPDVFLNVYNALSNKIFLATDESRYTPPRTQLDSLAHEYTHFFQFLESKKSLTSLLENDEYNESQAVDVQNWFRETNPCHL
jgi:hypothetical protein